VHRRTATKVVGGRALRKNNWEPTPSAYWGLPQMSIERERPGRGHRHLLTKRDVERFIGLLPDWDELSEGLTTIVLAAHEPDTDGWASVGVVALCAWPRELWEWSNRPHYDAHEALFERLGVEVVRERDGWGGYQLRWTESQARAYQLLHVLLHELGHHHDRITNRSKRAAARGEPYAERYALRYEARIWDAYLREFGLD
jgi:hypothetical protein